MKVIGWRRIDLDDPTKNLNLHGIKYYCTEDGDKNCVGSTCESFYASDIVLDRVVGDIEIGSEIIPVYKKESKVLRTIVII